MACTTGRPSTARAKAVYLPSRAGKKDVSALARIATSEIFCATMMPPTIFALGLAIAAMGIYVADADDAPGAAVIGMLLMAVGVVLGVRASRNRG
jgi:hypothetical protein